MKRIRLFMILSLLGLFLFSCSSKQQEETKMLPATAVKKSGQHSDLINIAADSVKVMLVKINDKEWTLRALIPIENQEYWDGYRSMGNLDVEFLDANGSPIDFELRPDWDVVESVLSSNSLKKEDLLAKEEYHAGKYKIIKEKFDKIAGLVLKEMNLTENYNRSSSSGSYSSSSSYSSSGNYDDDDIDLDDAVNAAKAATEMLKATGEAVKATNDMYKSAKKAEKELKKMEEDDDWGW